MKKGFLGIFIVILLGGVVLNFRLINAQEEKFFVEESIEKAVPKNSYDKMTENEVKTSDLFTGYVGYLGSGKTEIEKKLADYHNIPVEILKKRSVIDDVFAAMLTSKDQGGINAYIQSIGATMGLEGSYYDDCVDAATIELVKELCSNKVFLEQEIKKISKQFSNISKFADAGEITVALILKVTKNLSSKQVEKLVELAEDSKGTVIANADEVLDLMKIVATAAVIEDFKVEIVNGLMEEVNSDSELYAGLSRLRNDMKLNFSTYVTKMYVEKKMFSRIEKNIVSFFSLKSIAEITGKKFFGSSIYSIIGGIVLDSVAYLIHDVIKVPNAEEVITTYIYISFLQDINSAINRKETKFVSQVTMADEIVNYEKLFCTYLGCLKVTLKHTKSVANATDDETIDSALNELKDITYEAYIEECKMYIQGIPYKQRTIKNMDMELKYVAQNEEIVVLEPDDEIVPYSNVVYAFEGKLLYGISIEENGYSNINLDYISIPSIYVENNGKFSITKGNCVVQDVVEINGTSEFSVMHNASLFTKGNLQVNPNTSLSIWCDSDTYTKISNYGEICVLNDLEIKSHEGFFISLCSAFINHGSLYVNNDCILRGMTALLNESNGLVVVNNLAMYDTANAAYSTGTTVTNNGSFRVKGSLLEKEREGNIIQKDDVAKIEFDNDIPSNIRFNDFEKGFVYVHGDISNVTVEGTECLVFCGNKVQTVKNMSLCKGQILNKSGIVLESDMKITGDFYGNGNPIDVGEYYIKLEDEGWLSAGTDYQKVKLTDGYKVTKDMDVIGDVIAEKSATIDSGISLNVHGNMQSVYGNRGWLTVKGKLEIDGNMEANEYVDMKEDTSEIIVHGSTNHLGGRYLQNGTIRLYGSVTNLRTCGACEVIFSGDQVQELTSVSIYAGRNENTKGIQLKSDVNISGDFYGNGNPIDVGEHCIILNNGGWLSAETDYKKIDFINEYKLTKDMKVKGDVVVKSSVIVNEDVSLIVDGSMQSVYRSQTRIQGKLEVQGDFNAEGYVYISNDTAELTVHKYADFGPSLLSGGIVKLYGNVGRININGKCRVYVYKDVSYFCGEGDSLLVLAGKQKQIINKGNKIGRLIVNNEDGVLFQEKVIVGEIEQKNGDIDAPKGMEISNLKQDSSLRGSLQSLKINAWNDYNLELNNAKELDVQIPSSYEKKLEVCAEEEETRYIYKFSSRKLSNPRANKVNCSVDKGTKIYFYEGRVGSDIYYTLDGTEPTTASKLYEGEGIIIDKYTVLKAVSVMDGIESSTVVSFWYSIKKYNVDVDENVREFITVDSSSNEEGTTVTINVNPGQGKEFHEETLAVRYNDSYLETVVLQEKQKYSFIMPRSNVKISASIVNSRYTITYHVNGAENIPEEFCSYEFESGLLLPIPNRKGYRFDGWYNNEDLEGEKIICIDDNELGDKEFWAKWTEKDKIDNVHVTDFDTPTAEQPLDTGVSISNTGVSSTIIWEKEETAVSGNAEWKTTYRASMKLTADDDYAFDDTTSVTVNGSIISEENIVRNSDNVLIIACGEYTTATRKIIGAESPQVKKQFTNYYTEKDILSSPELGTTAKIALEGNVQPNLTDMDVEWTLANENNKAYDATPAAFNTFKWMVKESEYIEYDKESIAMEGTVTIQNKNYTPITISGSDVTLTYDGSDKLDVSSYFSIDAAAGTPNYELIKTSTGTGILEGTILTMTTLGSFDIKVTTPSNDVYAKGEYTLTLTVEKAMPNVIELPTVTDKIYHPTTILTNDEWNGGTVKGVNGENLSGVWSWKEANIVASVRNDGYVAEFTPEDTIHYKTVERTISVTVSKATLYIATMPTSKEITYGERLSASALSGATVQYSEEDETEISGMWTWKKASTKPTVKDSGVTEYDVIFTPTDTENYKMVETKITLIVNKSKNTPNRPESTMNTAYSNETVGTVALPAGWIWRDSDKIKSLEVDVVTTANAIYDGEDKGNYVTEAVEISITRQACAHESSNTVYDKTKTGVYSRVGGNVPKSLKNGDVVMDDRGTAKYKVVDATKKEVEYKVPVNKKLKTVIISDTVKISGGKYKVIKIGDNAFKGNKFMTKITVGSNIKSIGKNAFRGCKRLKTIKIKSTKLITKMISKKAFGGLTKVTTIKVPKRKLATYKKLFKEKGLSSKIKVKGFPRE